MNTNIGLAGTVRSLQRQISELKAENKELQEHIEQLNLMLADREAEDKKENSYTGIAKQRDMGPVKPHESLPECYRGVRSFDEYLKKMDNGGLHKPKISFDVELHGNGADQVDVGKFKERIEVRTSEDSRFVQFVINPATPETEIEETMPINFMGIDMAVEGTAESVLKPFGFIDLGEEVTLKEGETLHIDFPSIALTPPDDEPEGIALIDSNLEGLPALSTVIENKIYFNEVDQCEWCTKMD